MGQSKSSWRVIGSATIVAGVVIVFIASSNRRPVDASEAKPYTTWSVNEGSEDSAQYSALTQINKSNVSHLQQLWFYPTGDLGVRNFGGNPIIIDKVMYVIGRDSSIVALDAATGREIWVHSNGPAESINRVTRRGVTYWESKDRSDRRILYAVNNTLHALDARTGNLIDSFGDHGGVDLREGLGRDPKTIHQIQSGTPGRIFENLILMGSTTGEEYESPPGDIRAYDVQTGKLAWIFHTVPHPGEVGYDTWPKDAWKYAGGTNNWGGMAIDEKRGIAYFPLGSSTYDFYGGDRIGSDLFANCLIALNARTGKLIWYFQTVHHDLWDYDLTAAPKLLTVRHNGKMVDVVAQAGKTGFLYVFDRVTGKPLWPIEERPVPKSTMAGEQAWPTQPIPTIPPPFERQNFSPDDVNPYIADPAERAQLRDELVKARSDKMLPGHTGLFEPPGLDNAIQLPGNAGGANWGTAAVDPATGFVYVRGMAAPTMLKLAAKPAKRTIAGSPATKGKLVYIQNCQMCHTAELKGQPPAIPSLINIISRIGAQRVKYMVENGASPMPAFTDLSPAEVDQLIAYLTDPSSAHVPLSAADFAAPPPPTIAGSIPARYWSPYGYMISTDGLPDIKPPWTTLTAYDLNKGTIVWQIPDGGAQSLISKGVTNTGATRPQGGPVVTAGGLIFSGTMSNTGFRIYDKDTGKTLWEFPLSAYPNGIPAVYEVDGREYVVFAALSPPPAPTVNPGETIKGQHETQGYYVFALPADLAGGP